MKISSPFQDYYDFVPHMYGDAGDPNIRYIRTRVAEQAKLGTDLWDNAPVEDVALDVGGFNFEFGKEDERYDVALVIICGRVFPLVRKALKTPTPRGAMEDFVVVDYRTRPQLFNRCHRDNKRWTGKSYVDEDVSTYTFDQAYPVHVGAVELCKELQQPVLFAYGQYDYSPYYNRYKWAIHRRIPVLSHMGFPNLYEPEKLYQDLSYFVGNLMHESPDVQPAGRPPQTNAEKIESHGFDKKISFRHRK